MNSGDYLHALAEREQFTPLVARGYSSGAWSDWLPFGSTTFEPNAVQVFPNELVLESDDPDREKNRAWAETVSFELRKRGYSHAVFFSGGKSFHIHKWFSGLEALSPEWRTRAKKAFVRWILPIALADKVDIANLGPKTLVGLPFAPHRKTGLPKSLAWTFPANTNPLDLPSNVFPVALLAQTEHAPASWTPSAPGSFGKLDACGLCVHATTNRLANGTGRYRELIPNFLALVPSDEQIRALADAQGWPVERITRWREGKAWRGFFNCRQLQKFGERAGLRKICDACLLRNGTIRREGRYARMQNH